MRILCVQIVGLIPLISSTVHPKAPLCAFKTWISLSSYSAVKEDKIIIAQDKHILNEKGELWVQFSVELLLITSLYP